MDPQYTCIMKLPTIRAEAIPSEMGEIGTNLHQGTNCHWGCHNHYPAWAKNCRHDIVEVYFDQLSALYTKYKFFPLQIYNADETGMSCVHQPLKVCAIRKGKKCMGCHRWGKGANPYYFRMWFGQLATNDNFSKRENISWVDEGSSTTLLQAQNVGGWMVMPSFSFSLLTFHHKDQYYSYTTAMDPTSAPK